MASASLMAQNTPITVKLTNPDGSPAQDVSIVSKKTKNTATSNHLGIAHIEIAAKDNILVSDPRYYEVSAMLKDWTPGDTLTIPLTPDPDTNPASTQNAGTDTKPRGKYNQYGSIYEAISSTVRVKVIGNCILSRRAISNEECALVVIDGHPDADPANVMLSEVESIEFLETNQAAIYGVRAKYGALVITTAGNVSKVLHKE